MSMESMGLGGVLTFDATQAIPALEAARKGYEKLDSASDRLARGASQLGGAIRSGVMALAPVSLAFGFATKGAADFDQALADIRAASPGIAKQAMGAIEEKAKELGRTTRFSATEAAQAFLGLTKAGLDGAQSLQAITGVTAAAAAEGMNLASATDIVVKAMHAFNLTASDAGRIADVLALGSAASTSSMEELGQGLKYVGGLAHDLKIPLEATVAALAAVTNAGVDNTTAGTSLNQMLTRLNNPIRHTKEILQQMGYSTRDAHGEFKSLQVLIPELSKSLDMYGSGAVRVQAITRLLGDEGARAFRALEASLKDASGGSVVDLIEKMEGAKGAAQKMADTRMDSFTGSLGLLGKKFQSLSLDIFQPGLKVIREDLEKIGDVVDRIHDKFTALSSDDQAKFTTLIARLTEFLTVSLPIIGFLGAATYFVTNALLPGAEALVTTLEALAAFMASDAFLPLLVAIGALVLVWKLFDVRVKEFFVGFMERAGPAIAEFKGAWNSFVSEISGVWGKFQKAFGLSAGQSVDFWRSAGRVVADIFVASIVVANTALIIVMKTLEGIASLINYIAREWSAPTKSFWSMFGDEHSWDNVEKEWTEKARIVQDMRNTNGKMGVTQTVITKKDHDMEMSGAAIVVHKEDASKHSWWIDAADAWKNDSGPMNVMIEQLKKIHETLDKAKADIKVQTSVKVDGKEIALASGKHEREVTDRAGAKVTPYQRRLSIATGIPTTRNAL